MTYPLLGQSAINQCNCLWSGVYGVYKTKKERSCHESLNVKNSIVAGCCAGAVQTVIVCPVELIKIRMQNQSVSKQHACILGNEEIWAICVRWRFLPKLPWSSGDNARHYM